MKWPLWILTILDTILPARRVLICNDKVPPKLPWRNLVLLRDGGEDWSISMRCPCGCGQTIELPLIKEATPRWSLNIEKGNLPTLSPSIWLHEKCRAHFFVKHGRVIWVKSVVLN